MNRWDRKEAVATAMSKCSVSGEGLIVIMRFRGARRYPGKSIKIVWSRSKKTAEMVTRKRLKIQGPVARMRRKQVGES